MEPASPESSLDFGFAFDDVNFSDRILRIVVLSDLPGSKTDDHHNLADCPRNHKRHRDGRFIDANVAVEQHEEQILNLEDVGACENQEDVAVAANGVFGVGAEIAVAQLDHEPIESNEPYSTEYSAVQIKTIHISSAIMAAKSSFFYKLFSNGMRESEQRNITLRIHVSEEAAFFDLLKFMYTNTLPRTSPTAILDLLMAADKYEVATCMRHCSQVLQNLPMTCELALLYLDLPSTVLMADTVLPLAAAARLYLAAQFKDISKFREEALKLPLAGIEAVLFSDDLQITSEDAVYDFVLKWARMHYPKLEERQEILSTRLLRLVRFPSMSCRKLKKVLSCSDINPELASKVVLNALFFKAETPYRKPCPVVDEGAAFNCFVERAYKYRPVKVVEFELPRQQCVVYLDLKREDCVKLFPGGRIYSQAFHLGGQGFFLSGHCNMDQQTTSHCFGLFLGMQDNKGSGSGSFTVEYEFGSRVKPSMDFSAKYKASYTFTGGKAVGYRNLFGVAWPVFIAEDSPYFLDGVLYLGAKLTVKKLP